MQDNTIYIIVMVKMTVHEIYIIVPAGAMCAVPCLCYVLQLHR